jgi:ATP-dependent DNA ligase
MASLFDLLRLDRNDLRLRPIEERRSALQRLVAGDGILFSEALAADARSCSPKPASSVSKASCRSGRAASIAAAEAAIG